MKFDHTTPWPTGETEAAHRDCARCGPNSGDPGVERARLLRLRDNVSWWGQVKQLQSGGSAPFLAADGMLGFVRRFVAIERGEERPARVEERKDASHPRNGTWPSPING